MHTAIGLAHRPVLMTKTLLWLTLFGFLCSAFSTPGLPNILSSRASQHSALDKKSVVECEAGIREENGEHNLSERERCSMFGLGKSQREQSTSSHSNVHDGSRVSHENDHAGRIDCSRERGLRGSLHDVQIHPADLLEEKIFDGTRTSLGVVKKHRVSSRVLCHNCSMIATR